MKSKNVILGLYNLYVNLDIIFYFQLNPQLSFNILISIVFSIRLFLIFQFYDIKTY